MINRVVLVGRLTRDPELRKTPTGGSIASFTVAVDNRTKNADAKASFIPCKVFAQQAENVAKFTRQGSLVGIEGRLSQNSFTRKDGTKGSAIEVICDSVQFLEPKSANGASTSNSVVEDSIQDTSFDDDTSMDGLNLPTDDLPF